MKDTKKEEERKKKRDKDGHSQILCGGDLENERDRKKERERRKGDLCVCVYNEQQKKEENLYT